MKRRLPNQIIIVRYDEESWLQRLATLANKTLSKDDDVAKIAEKDEDDMLNLLDDWKREREMFSRWGCSIPSLNEKIDILQIRAGYIDNHPRKFTIKECGKFYDEVEAFI